MSVFAICFPFVLENEAAEPPSYNSVPDAPDGSFAIAGINSHYWPADYDRIAALPLADRPAAVADFYQRNFWNQWLEQIASNTLAAMVMDSEVNQGQGTGVKVLQMAVNMATGLAVLTVDGAWGPNTVEHANACDEGLLNYFIAGRQARYRAIGGPNLDAWLTRASKIPQLQSA